MKNTRFNLVTIGVLALVVAPPIIGVAVSIGEFIKDNVGEMIENSDKIKEIKKEIKLKNEGVITVKYEEV